MPTPTSTETESEFVDRCIPIVIADGTAQDGSQAAAICHSKWDEAHKVDMDGLRKSMAEKKTLCGKIVTK